MGCVGIRVDDPSEVEAAIDKANSINDRPVVVDFRVDAREIVYPMIAPGTNNDAIMLPPSQSSRKEFLK
jgi:acetolactate synthase-1/2/3 large subunit